MEILKVLLLLACVTAATADQYVGYNVYRITPVTEGHLRHLRKLEGSSKLDFWTSPHGVDVPVDIHVGPKYQRSFLKLMDWLNIDVSLHIENVQRLIDIVGQPRIGREMNWDDYHTLDTINTWTSSLPDLYPDLVTGYSLGPSFEGRMMPGVKISKGTAKHAVWIEGQIHAREWISSATVTWMLNEILTSSDPEVIQMSEDFDWYFTPVINPDGFLYSQTDDRMWRKTRSNFSGDVCLGADANRNWDYHWGGEGSSDDPCSSTYHGTTPFSEPEIQAISNTILHVANHTQLVTYLSYHSYGQYFLYPWSYDATEPIPDLDDVDGMGNAAADAIQEVYGTVYQVGSTYDMLYPASGASKDWAYAVAGSKYSYTVELRDTGDYGFLLPPEQIIPTAEEMFEGLKAIYNWLKAEYLKK